MSVDIEAAGFVGYVGPPSTDGVGRPARVSPTDQTGERGIAWAVTSQLSPLDHQRLGELVALAEEGMGVQILRAIELARVRPSRAEQLRRQAPEGDIAKRLLGAVLDIRGSEMLAQGLNPTDDASRELLADQLYARRGLEAGRATKETAYRVDTFHWYQIGCIAIVAAGQRIPSRDELADPKP